MENNNDDKNDEKEEEEDEEKNTHILFKRRFCAVFDCGVCTFAML